ncbi:MAG: acetylxylan esterase, partial [Bryobacteraceae bacterium]
MIQPTSLCTRRAAASTLFGAFCGWSAAKGQSIPANYDESKVGSYTLPDPLTLENGQRVQDPQTWYRRRRPEIFR